MSIMRDAYLELSTTIRLRGILNTYLSILPKNGDDIYPVTVSKIADNQQKYRLCENIIETNLSRVKT